MASVANLDCPSARVCARARHGHVSDHRGRGCVSVLEVVWRRDYL
jgi:hypothetical protein